MSNFSTMRQIPLILGQSKEILPVSFVILLIRYSKISGVLHILVSTIQHLMISLFFAHIVNFLVIEVMLLKLLSVFYYK